MTIEATRTTEVTLAATLIGTIVTAVRAALARRAQRIALGELLRMDPTRLDDLGINQQDVIEALNATPPAGPHLEARRAARIANHHRTTAAA